jgi:dTDP-4-dehydrorhamnose 3,5-epimerase
LIKKTTSISGFYELEPHIASDDRGTFIKIFHQGIFKDLDLNTDWPEEYYSISRRGVLRGMHFQVPPFDHAKVVFCTSGQILDVALDLRQFSPTYGKYASFILSSESLNMAYLTPGLAHGFYVLSQSATVFYKVSTTHYPKADSGIRWDSFGFHWPSASPVLSDRDQRLEQLSDFKSPFLNKLEKW